MKAILALVLGFAAMAVAAPTAEPVAEAAAAPEADLDKRFFYRYPEANAHRGLEKRFFYRYPEANAHRGLEKRFFYRYPEATNNFEQQAHRLGDGDDELTPFGYDYLGDSSTESRHNGRRHY